MKRLVVGGIVAAPILMVAGGLYILIATPNVVTEQITYVQSHTTGLMLVGLGAVVAVVVGMLASEDWR
jgi:hypothetical protein